MLAQTAVKGGVHTVGIDAMTGNAWIVWSQEDGHFVQSFGIK